VENTIQYSILGPRTLSSKWIQYSIRDPRCTFEIPVNKIQYYTGEADLRFEIPFVRRRVRKKFSIRWNGNCRTYYVGTIKSVGRIYQQTFLDTNTKVAFAKLYDRKNALVAADMLNDRVLPFFEEQKVPLLRVLTDRGTEYCGQREHHEYQLYLAVENIDHTRTKARHPQTNGICERFHRTIQEEFYATAFRKKLYHGLEELQADLDEWMRKYNLTRTHSGKYCYGKTSGALRSGAQAEARAADAAA
jgi:transposase InsO family protein